MKKTPHIARDAGESELADEKQELLELLLAEQGFDANLQPRQAIERIGAEQAPLSSAQKRLWLLYELSPESTAYNLTSKFRVHGDLDLAVLEIALQKIVERHEILRTTFHDGDDGAVQVIHSELPPEFSVEILAGREPDDQQEILSQAVHDESRLPFDLSQGPPLRIRVLKLGQEEYVLLISAHHMVYDGYSIGVFVRELAELYQAGGNGISSRLKPLDLQYADFAQWQSGQDYGAELNYWKRQLADLPQLELPTDRPHPSAPSLRGANQSLVLPMELKERLQELGQQQGATLFMTLLAAFQALLHRYSGQEDFAVGVPVANRSRSEIEDLIGFFVNTLAIRANAGGDVSFREFLDRTRDAVADAFSNQDAPFEQVVEALQPDRSSGHVPLVQAMFVLQNAPVGSLELDALSLEPEMVDSGTAKFDLTFLFEETPDGLEGQAEYSTDIFDQATIARLLGHFRMLLESIVANPDQRLSDLSLLTEEERSQIVDEWKGGTSNYPSEESIAVLFERQAEATPDGMALAFGKQHFAYRELNERANQLARHLESMGVGPEKMVGLFAERSAEMIVAMLAILKAGGAYVPLDPDYPEDRLRLLLDDTRPPVILTLAHLEKDLPAGDQRIVRLDEDWTMIAAGSRGNQPCRVDGGALAYVIYTSGSTGEPKGVMVTHRAVNRLVLNTDFVDLQTDDRIAQASTPTFDAATFEIWGALLNGACLVGVEKKVAIDPVEFAAFLRDERITTLFLTTALFNQMAREAPKAFRSLRDLLFGGELVNPHWVREVLKNGLPERLLHVYGPTENTTFSTWYLVSELPSSATTVPIGRAVANSSIYVLDAKLNPSPVGVPGELYVGGDGLASGYLNRPKLTAEQFIANPFDCDQDSKLYKTGDIVRWLSDGNIEFLGRRDDQVKIRGFRIELGEIEAALLRQPGVREAVVLAPANERGELELAAYVAPLASGTLDAQVLRDALAAVMPGYMVPARYSVMNSLPLNENGKVDRPKLPPPAAPLSKGHIAPQTETELKVAGIFAEVLGVDDVGAEDNFFELGGHSLIATQVVSRVREALSTELPLRRLFELPTVAALAKDLESRNGSAVAGTQQIRAADGDGPAPLSFAQERLWFLDQLEPGNPFYNVPSALRMKGNLNIPALADSIQRVVERHDVLRTFYPDTDGEPSQVVADHLQVPLPVVDLSELPAEERAADVSRRTAEEARCPFELTTGPLIRSQLLRLGHEEHVLLFTMHHIVSDGWSMGVLVDEIVRLYIAALSSASDDNGSELDADEPVLAELPIQYGDFAAWQRSWLRGEVLEDQLAYWQQQLADVPPVLELPADRPRPPKQSYRGSSVNFVVDVETTAGLRRVAQKKEATLFMTLLAAWSAFLYRYSGQDDIVIGTPIANRNRREIESLIGFFVNTLALRVELKGNPAFLELVARVRHVALDAYTHQDLPFERLVDEIHSERDLSLNPLFQVMFALQNMPDSELELPGLRVDHVETKRVAALFDLVLDMWEVGDSLTAVLEYNTDLFDEASVEKIVESFQTLLHEVAANPACRVDELPLLTGNGQEQLLSLGRGPEVDYPVDRTIHQHFEAMVERHPERVAIVHNGRSITYAELNSKANQIAHWLRGQGLVQNDFVGILLHRSPEFLAAQLGALKAGGAFLPIDPAYPAERIQYMLADSQNSTLVSNAEIIAEVYSSEDEVAKLALLDISTNSLDDQPTTNPIPVNSSSDVAYLLYTSGSTGLPKGAMVRHDGAVNHIFAEFDLLAFHSESAFLQSAPSSSDISVWQFLAPVLIGGKTVVADFETVCDPALLFEAIKSESISLIELVPVVMNELLEYAAGLPDAERELSELESAMITGEAAPVAVVNRWLEMFPDVRLVNAYGPTEAADDICQYEIHERLGNETRNVPIGRPLANLSLYVLDRNLSLVPQGVPGEICVSGVGVGFGYWNNEAKTRENFVANPYSTKESDRVLYRTGDLGRWLPDGNLECLARLDQQVKIRGFRIETGEIEAVLGRHPAVHEAAVIVREDQAGDRRLAAYFVPQLSSDYVVERLHRNQRDQIDLWQDLHEDSYVETLNYDDPTFNVIGWDSNYTGQPLPREDMREYVDFTVEGIRSLEPRRVLEIGAGTGLIMFPLLPHVESYVGTDLSRVAIRQLRELMQSPSLRERFPDFEKARLEQRRADDVDWLEPHAFDTVILPSVVQYFPGIDYLRLVLESLIESIVEPGGSIFLGDVRSLPLLEAFHASVQLFKSGDELGADELAERVRNQLVREQEMAIDPSFFLFLAEDLPKIQRVEILPKRGRALNEMTRFRYDVVIHLAGGDSASTTEPAAATEWIDWRENKPSTAELRRQMVEGQPARLAYRRVSNIRVAESLQTLDWLSAAKGTVGDLKNSLQAKASIGLEPEDLRELAAELGYDLVLSLASARDDGSFDAVFTHPSAGVAANSCVSEPPSASRRHANNPLREKLALGLASDLREFVRDKLPNYMAPSDIAMLDKLPLTPAGKIDRDALPQPEQIERASDNYLAPRTHEEEVMCDVWAEVLSLERVGVRDNFFALGGHSLKATQAVSRIHRELSVEIALRDIFARPTIEELAGGIADRGVSQFEGIPRIPDAEHYELSHAQRRLWVLSQMEDGLAAYNMPTALVLEGPIDFTVFQQALEALVERHESLRTAFVAIDGKPRQQVAARTQAALRFTDLSDEADPDSRARQLAQADAVEPFDLQQGNLLRATLLKLSTDRHALLFNIHHIVSDDGSMQVLVGEFVQLYDALAQGRKSSLAPLALQYRDYAHWQNRYLASDASNPDRDYWLTKLGGQLPLLDLPADFRRPLVKTFHGRSLNWQLDERQTAALESFGQERGASLFMTLVALMDTLIYRYTGQEDIIVGFPIAGRDHEDLESQIGFFVNTLPLRVQVDGESSFEAVLDEVKTSAVEAYQHQAYPFDRLVDELQVARDASRHPMFDVVAVMLSDPPAQLSLEGVTISPLLDEYEGSKFDLHFVFEKRDGKLEAAIVYNTDLFLPQRIDRMSRHMRQMVDSVLTNAAQPIGRLRFMAPDEQQQLLAFRPEPKIYECPQTLVELFESQVAGAPAETAVLWPGDDRVSLTYAELNSRANQLAHHLLSIGVKTGDLIGLCLNRSLDTVVSILGVLKSGAAYVPFDTTHPPQRLQFQLQDTGAEVLITRQEFVDSLPTAPRHLICLDSDREGIARQPEDNPSPQAGRDDIAYVIYTSGSTGQPKGVPVSHYQVSRLFAATEHWFQFGRDDVWTLFHSYAFDFSVWEIWGALLHGGRLLVVPHATTRSPELFYELLATEGVTVLNQTPSAFRQLVQFEGQYDGSLELDLRLVIFGGEALDLPGLQSWFSRHAEDRPRLVNMYGITETTVHVTYREISSDDVNQTASLIGEPLPDLTIRLLDDELNPVPIGVPGEICVGGAGVTNGYLARPELTAERFVKDPWSADPTAKLYRSGDLGRYREDGDIEYLGRLDDQIQIRGFRVELGEIGAAVADHPCVADAVVIAEDFADGVRLLAYYTASTPVRSDGADSPEELDSTAFRSFLRERLPEHMIPAAFVPIVAIPLTPNGKLNRAALPAPEEQQLAVATKFIAPRNDSEKQIADVFREVLRRDTIGVDDNFFDLGVNSLLLVEINTRLRDALQREIPIVWMFQYSTVRSLAEQLAPRDEPAVTVVDEAKKRAARQLRARGRRRKS